MRRRTVLAGTGAAALGLAAGLPSARAVATGRSHALSLLGEPALPADFTHFPYVNPDAPKGGTVVQHAIGSYDSFNPFIVRGVPAAGIGLIWMPLMASSQDEASTEYCDLAEWVEVAPDRTWVAFELRGEAAWHDGRPVTAEDVAWTFATLREHGRPFYRAYWGDVVQVLTEGPRRVVFRFRDGANRELPLILGQILVLPRHWWEGRDFTRPILEPPLGCGAYRLDGFEAGRSVSYRRVAGWWGERLPTQRGLNNIDLWRFEYFRDATVALEAFKAGQLDFRQENVARDWATAYDFPARRRGLVKLEEIPHELPTGMQAFVFNLRRPLFQDRRVREALMLAFDFEWANANLFYGAYARTRSYFSNSELASSGLPQGEERALLERYRGRIPEEVFTREFTLPVTDGSGNNREQLRRALELLRAAGWRVANQRMVNAQGQPFSFELLLSSPSFERVALPYAQWLQRLGIEMRVRTVDTAQYQARTDSFDYDMIVDVFGQSLSPGNEQRDYWSCAKAKEPGSRNSIGLCDPVVDELVELVINAPDRASLIQRCRALDRVLLWGHYVVPHWHSRVFRVAYWDKFARPARTPRYGLGFTAWWVDPAKAARIDAERGRR
ncbi:ABC transporter substrate-binding protein [Elioraea sp. Yellowstone]|jgi:microcin C transport system substrate-binding protein|uniref:extracellular solute-binding protein n=1 Tax=Elioraea sp. Yellowstone TaxID=2592070 RepID=UPI00114E8BEF|nr:extracellular solute-binding protein [Elioraea sp. Yellowstone]TQF78339.1 ABC transporter substrate-binding protein [Elioraea sp. Yellowstone]